MKLRGCGVILNNHAAFVEEVSLKNVGVVPLVYFARRGIGRQGCGCCLVVRSALVAPGTRNSSFGMCHISLLIIA